MAPESSERGSASDEDEEATRPMDEEEKPPQPEAREKTVVSPPPEEKPREGPARTRTVERKLNLPADLQAAPARTRTAERKLNLPPEAQAAPPRTRTVERKLNLPPEAQAAPPRTRTVERKLNLPPEAQAAPPRTRTVERKLQPAPPPTRDEEDENKITTAPTTLPGAATGQKPPSEPDTLRDSPLHTLPGAPPQGRGNQPQPERTVMVPYPEPPSASRSPAGAAADFSVPRTDKLPQLTEPSAPGSGDFSVPRTEQLPQLTLPGAPESADYSIPRTDQLPQLTLPGVPGSEEEEPPPPISAERTVMVKAPEASASASAQQAKKQPAPRPEPKQDATGRTLPSNRKTVLGPEKVDTVPQAGEVEELAPGMKLGGYQLLRKIGAGGMGTVWLAQQLSLDREVAVKILRPGFATDPQFVLRFAQEAFAAAQLVHHNIVQIYDFGSDKQIHFFSMEFVDATNLLTLVRRGEPIEVEEATGYVLQAARGLKFAHDRGMVHRDIKPDNLLLNNNGIVKVGDMGLVKLSRTARRAQSREEGQGPVTYIGKNPQEYAMGTPAYMAPEQVMNSSKVDARADIYSLGCTLYHLITGRPPFVHENLNTVMDMHVKEAPLPPDKRNREVNAELSAIVMKMMAKRPDERYQDMGEVIRALERFLGFEGNATFAPREQHATLLERCVQEFNASRWARLRRWLVFGLMFLTAIVTGLVEWRLPEPWGIGVAAFAGLSWIASFIMRGLLEKGALFMRFRQFVVQAPPLTWLVWWLLISGTTYGLYRFNLLVPIVGMMGAALLVAIAFYLLVDRHVEKERRPPVSQVEQMLRSMRLRGLEEGAIRQFVCVYGGENWEAFFEALFGYDAKMTAREKWGRNSRDLPRERHSAWRDPLIRWMDKIQASRRRRKEQKQLRMLERKKVAAQAEQKAQEEAEAEAGLE